MATRNTARWQSQEQGEIDYDAKNMLHCMRLVMSGASILRDGAPLVRFSGVQRQLLKDILAGSFSYEEIMAMVEREVGSMERELATSNMPLAPDMDQVEQLLREATALWESGNV